MPVAPVATGICRTAGADGKTRHADGDAPGDVSGGCGARGDAQARGRAVAATAVMILRRDMEASSTVCYADINAAPAGAVDATAAFRLVGANIAGDDTFRYTRRVALCFVGEHDPPEESDATIPLHRQSPGRRGDRRDAADDRPVGRQAVRGHCGGHGAGHRSGRAGGRARARRCLGTARAGGEGPSARETCARDPRPCRRTRAASRRATAASR